MTRCAAAAAAGYARIRPLMQPGVSERTLQIDTVQIVPLLGNEAALQQLMKLPAE